VLTSDLESDQRAGSARVRRKALTSEDTTGWRTSRETDTNGKPGKRSARWQPSAWLGGSAK